VAIPSLGSDYAEASVLEPSAQTLRIHEDQAGDDSTDCSCAEQEGRVIPFREWFLVSAIVAHPEPPEPVLSCSALQSIMNCYTALLRATLHR
jgi:hypothetical protein